MICEIEWNSLSPPEWDARFKQIVRSNILQSYEYALAICPMKKQKGRWGLIKIDGQEAGLVQILEAGILGNLLHAAAIDRGPLWFDCFGNADHFDAFCKALRKHVPKRLGRKIRFMPNVEDNAQYQGILKSHGFKKRSEKGYQTIWLDLRAPRDLLRDNLKKNWRNMLSRAEKEGIETDFSFDADELKEFLKKYSIDKAAKGYDGLSVEYSIALIKTFAPKNQVLFARVNAGGAIAGYGLFFIHGNSATYQIGWTSTKGKTIGAQNKLLWDSLLELKAKGITDLDLGGVNDETAKGIKKFKDGMGGELATYAGLYS